MEAHTGSHDDIDRWISVVSRVSCECQAFVEQNNESMDFGRVKVPESGDSLKHDGFTPH